MKEYIEREPILKDIEEMLNAVRQHINITGRGSGKTLWEGIGRGIIYCSKKLLAAPAADVVEVRHAKWDDNHKCTACGNEALLEEKPDTMAHGLNSLFFVDSDYCPHCGALMDKEE